MRARSPRTAAALLHALACGCLPGAATAPPHEQTGPELAGQVYSSAPATPVTPTPVALVVGDTLDGRAFIAGREPGPLDLLAVDVANPTPPAVSLQRLAEPGQFRLLAVCPGTARLAVSLNGDGGYGDAFGGGISLSLSVADPSRETLGFGWNASGSAWQMVASGQRLAVAVGQFSWLRAEWDGDCNGVTTQQEAMSAQFQLIAPPGFEQDLFGSEARLFSSKPGTVQFTASVGAAQASVFVDFQ